MPETSSPWTLDDDATIAMSKRIGGVGRLRVADFMTTVAMRMAAREIDSTFPNLGRLQRAWKINTLGGTDRFADMRLEEAVQHAESVGLRDEWLILKRELAID